MEFRKVIAILKQSVLENIEKRLREMGVKGITVTQVKGYGENKALLAKDWLVSHVRLEVVTEKTKAEKIVNAIVEVAHTGGSGDGIVYILPVERVIKIRSKSEATLDEV